MKFLRSIILLLFALSGSLFFNHIPMVHMQDDPTITHDELASLPPLILLTVNRNGNNDLAIYDWATDELTYIVASAADEGHATWSADGSRLAFQTNRDGNWEIYLYHMATGALQNLTNAPSSEMYPNWTPDGQVVHMSDRTGEPALYVSDPLTGDIIGLTDTDDCMPDYHPNFSPLGDKLAYRADCAGSGDIWHLNLNTDARTNLTLDSDATDRYPAWSPDGEQILFVSHRDASQEIYVMDSDGANLTNLSNHDAMDNQGSWSPDGQFIIFISDRDGPHDLWIMEADGSRQTKLLSTGENLNWPWWQPLGDSTGEMDMSGQGNADVEFVKATEQSNGTWRFDVTVRHPDTGWEDYADGWDVVLPNGTVLKGVDDPFTRLLLHPHENEQPFTRSQSGLVIPDDVTLVTVRAHDLVDGWGGQEVIVDLTQDTGENFEVIRR